MRSPNGRLHQKPLAKGKKGKILPVVSLLPDSHEHLALITNTFCARNMGAHVQRTSLECQRYKKRDKKLDSHAAKKGRKEISK